MINLLPLESKIKIKKEYLMRLAIALSISFFFSALIAIAFLLPSLFLVNSQEKNYERQISLSEQRLAFSKMAGTIPAVEELNSKLELFEDRRKNTGKITGIIEKIINSKPWGIKLNGFNYNNGAMPEDGGSVSIKGSSVNRQYLLEFVDTLKKSREFKEIKSPASNLLKESEIEFNVFIVLKDYEN